MENKIKTNCGRPRLFNDEERKAHKTNYMLNKEWYCYVCNNNKNYTMAGKTLHEQTKKHKRNFVNDKMYKNSLLIKEKINEMDKELAKIQG